MGGSGEGEMYIYCCSKDRLTPICRLVNAIPLSHVSQFILISHSWNPLSRRTVTYNALLAEMANYYAKNS